MAWNDDIIDCLAGSAVYGYHANGPAATEPTALAGLALAAAGRWSDTHRLMQWLGMQQNADGSLGPTPDQHEPGWPTSLAVMAATVWRDASPCPLNVTAAVHWIRRAKGESLPRNSVTAHDTTIVAWPWVGETHSWVEPTALCVLALQATGRAVDSRAIDGRRMLKDRLLPGGGCNYGNTLVMGQELRPHIQPTALALMALHGEPDRDGRISKSLDFLVSELGPETAAASLAYGVMALTLYDRRPRGAYGWLEAACRRTIRRDASPYRLALLSLAAAENNPLLEVARNGATHLEAAHGV